MSEQMPEGGQGAEFKETVFREISGVMGALSEPARLELLELLCQCERGVEEAAGLVGSKVNTVSHHLRVLADHTLVRSRKTGRSVRYRATSLGLRLWTTVAELASSELAEIKVAVQELLAADESLEHVDYPELVKRLSREEVVVVDVRPREEFDSGHLPGAVSAPPEELRERIEQIPRDKHVVAYCRGRYCVLSHEAVQELRRRGYSASWLDEGIAEWRASGAGLESGEGGNINL